MLVRWAIWRKIVYKVSNQVYGMCHCRKGVGGNIHQKMNDKAKSNKASREIFTLIHFRNVYVVSIPARYRGRLTSEQGITITDHTSAYSTAKNVADRSNLTAPDLPRSVIDEDDRWLFPRMDLRSITA
jgi:hypothetical protein